MIGRDADKASAHQRVRARCVDSNFAAVGALKAELQPARAANPVLLHQADLCWPILKLGKGILQFASHIADLEEPLRQFAAFHFGVRSPAFTVNDLLVGQNGHVDRIPIHDGIFAIDQPSFEEIEEKRLLLAVIFRVTGCEHAFPIQAEAHWLHLCDHVVDILVGPVFGVAANGHRGVFSRHPEGVKTHWMQHVKPLRLFVTRDHVTHCVVAHVSDVNAPRRIGEHFEHVILRLGCVAFGPKQAGRIPGVLPAGFDVVGRIRHGLVSQKNAGQLKARRGCSWNYRGRKAC